MLKKTIFAAVIAAAIFLPALPASAYRPLERQSSAVELALRPSYSADGQWLGSGVEAPVPALILRAKYSPFVETGPRGEGGYGLFGSIAMPMATLPAAKKWKNVAREPLSCEVVCANGVGLRLSKAIDVAAGKPAFEALSLINSSVNNLIRYRSDKSDRWATAAQTIAAGAGDCEDFAITKMWMLRSMGMPAEQLQMVVLRNKASGAFHAVLAVHVGGTSYVLDNLSNRVLPDTALKNYVPIQSFSGDRGFLHGVANRQTDTAQIGS